MRIDTTGIMAFEYGIADIRISVLENQYDRMPSFVPVDQREN